MSDQSGFVVAFATGRVYELDLVKQRFADAAIPCFGQARDIAGLTTSIEPPSPGPGVSFELLVPPDRLREAQEVIGEFGLDTSLQPDQWHFNPSAKAQGWWRWLAIATLVATAWLIVQQLIEALG